MITDDMIHGTFTRTRRPARIETETPLVPQAVATAVVEEASVWLQTPLPRRWIRELVAHANTVYDHNPRFRRQIRGHGNRGRDHLWTFMRHWLAALMARRRQQLYSRLPASYRVGCELPARMRGLN